MTTDSAAPDEPTTVRVNKLYRSEVQAWEKNNILFMFYRFYPDQTYVYAMMQFPLKNNGDYTAESLGTPGKNHNKGTWSYERDGMIKMQTFAEQGLASQLLGREPAVTSTSRAEVFPDRIVIHTPLPNSSDISKGTLWLLP